jgi:hypothetical protein
VNEVAAAELALAPDPARLSLGGAFWMIPWGRWTWRSAASPREKVMPAIHSTWTWGIAAAVLVAGTFLSTILATVIVDTLLIRPVPASVNTLLPGWAYGAVAILKVCLVAGLAAVGVFVFTQARLRWFPILGTAATDPRAETGTGSAAHSDASENNVPGMAILSVLLPSAAPLVGALGVVTTQALTRVWGDVTMRDVEQFSRVGVLVMGVCLIVGFGAGGLAVFRHKGGRPLALLGLATNACLIALFWYWEFYAAGFDQDRWAPS